VRAGLVLVDTVATLAGRFGTTSQLRVGIATGLVVVGDLLANVPGYEYDVVGKTPHLAAKLQALAEPDTVVIDSNTRRLLGYLFEYHVLGPLSVKGFDDPVAVWRVTRVSAVDSRFEALRTLTTPTVGRNEEIEFLTQRWGQAKTGEGSVALISGEPGIGKSRIVQSVLEHIKGERHARLRYFCSPHHQDTALYPVIRQVERAARFRREDTVEQRLEKLGAVLALATNDLSEAVPLLAQLLSIPARDLISPLNLSPQRSKNRLFRTLLGQFEGLAVHQSVLMVFEDVQWIDPTTRELLDLVINRLPTLRALLIITFRPEFAPPWIGRRHVTFLSLSRLPPRESAEMTAQVTGGKVLPKQVADQIVDRTDGVPLFIEELTKAVVESGVLTDAGDHYAAVGPVAPLAIPATLQASLLARLDRMAPTREVAQIGAALGRQFSYELISAVAKMPKQQLDDTLARLVQAELIFRRGSPPDAEYIFKHALVQEAAYATLLRSRRQQLHARIAATLEDQFPEIVVAHPALLAQHWVEAGLAEKAGGYRLRAGQQALARSAMTEAVAQLQKGLELLAGLEDGHWRRQLELDLQIALISALSGTKGWSATAVGKTIDRARALAEQIDRPEYLVLLLHNQWVFHLIRSEHNLALALAERIEKIGEARSDVAVQLLGRLANGQTRTCVGDFVAARALLEQCHGLGDPTHRAVDWRATDPYAAMLVYLAASLAYLGYIDQARSRVNEALAEARRPREVQAQTLAVVLLNAIYIESMTRSPKLQQHAEELLALSTEHGFPLFFGYATVIRGWSLTTLGRAREGLTMLKQGLVAIRAAGAVAGTPIALIRLAEAHAILGQSVEGLNCLAEAGQIIAMTEERRNEAELHRARADLLYAAGDRPAAEQSYRQALAVAKRQCAKLLELRAAIGLARLWGDHGKCSESRDLLASIYAWFTEGFDTPILQEAKALLDALR
jgi:predicted ATPase